jgi:16S rRNA (guanine527-N7)-methyltransferase
VIRAALEIALADLPVGKDPRVLDLLSRHWELVSAWNARVNLTSIEDATEAAWLHYRDSLEALAVLAPGGITDLGSGAGYPGIPLAIAEATRAVTLVEPRRKRVSFLQTVVARLGLDNVRVVEGRSEDPPGETSANVVSRATFSDMRQLRACEKWVAPGGRLIAFRSDPSGDAAARAHLYRLRDETRLLEIWDIPAR